MRGKTSYKLMHTRMKRYASVVLLNTRIAIDTGSHLDYSETRVRVEFALVEQHLILPKTDNLSGLVLIVC